MLINHIKKISLRKELHEMAALVKIAAERWRGEVTEVRWGRGIADILDASSEASLLEFTRASRARTPEEILYHKTSRMLW